jgi:hypothetical protein
VASLFFQVGAGGGGIVVGWGIGLDTGAADADAEGAGGLDDAWSQAAIGRRRRSAIALVRLIERGC